MIHNRYSRFSLCLTFLLAWLTIMGGCTTNIQQAPADSSPDAFAIATQSMQNTNAEFDPVFTMAFTPTETTKVGEGTSQAPTAISESTEQPTSTATPQPTIIPSPSLIPTLESSPTVVPVECQNTGTLPEQVFLTSINMDSAHAAMSADSLYLAVDQYVGKFDVSKPKFPEFLGFWQVSDVLDISDIVVHNGIVYIASGPTILAMNASSQCQFETISYLSIPLQIIRLELEDDRLYAGGISDDDGKRVVAIISLDNMLQPEELGTVDLGQEPAIWSVFEETLYSLSGDKFAVTNVSDPIAPNAQPVNLILDPEVLNFTPRWFVRDTLYMLWGSDTLTIIKNLEAISPTIISQDDHQYILIDVFQVQNEYIFLGVNRCENECASGVMILSADDGQKLSSMSLYPHYPVYSFQEVKENLLYAFTDNTLLVIDISNTDKPEVVNEVQFVR